MKKNSKIPLIISYVLVTAMILAAIGLLVGQAAMNGWVFESDNVVKFGLVLIGLLITLVKLITGTGGGASLRKYESAFRKHIGSAFSRPNQKKQKRELLRAIKLYSENRFNAAISRLTALQKFCSSKDDYSSVMLFLATSYSDNGSTDDAISTYEELVKIVPDNSTAWSNLGSLYRKQGNNERAIVCIETALEWDKENAYAWNNLAQAYLAAGKWEKVILSATRSVELKEDMYQAETALTVAYFALGEQEKSKQHFDKAVLHGANAASLSSVLNGMTHGSAAFGNTDGVSEKVILAVGHLQRDTALPMVELRLPAPDDGNRSRFGGAPVDPVPPTDSNGAPMKLLAAIWCSEVRGVPDFPTRGVLRFYVRDNDIYGANFDRPFEQTDFRVLYDENEDGFDTELRDDSEVSDSFPIRHVLPLRLTPAMGSIRTTDYRFDSAVADAFAKAGIEGGMNQLNDPEFDYVHEQNEYAGHRIGGYPCFEQFDPRGDNAELQKYDTLLLQIVSHVMPDGKGGYNDLIMFGDEGGCQFFIPRQKLAARDFSDVMFWWDCG